MNPITICRRAAVAAGTLFLVAGCSDMTSPSLSAPQRVFIQVIDAPIGVGTSAQITALVEDRNGHVVTQPVSLDWSSVDSTIVAVSPPSALAGQNVTLRAKRVGSTRIVAASSGLTPDTAAVTVE